MSTPLTINDKITLPGSDLEWTAVKSSGPGGQNVNKVASKVELRVALACVEGLDARTAARLRALAGARLTDGGELVITSTKTRDQGRNLADALAKLQALLQAAQALPRPRHATRPTRGSVERRLSAKQRRSDAKAARRCSSDD